MGIPKAFQLNVALGIRSRLAAELLKWVKVAYIPCSDHIMQPGVYV